MRPENAAEIGRDALIWLANQPETMARFLEAGGLAPGDLRARVEDPEFLGFVLEFLLGDEALLLAFCAETGLAPSLPSRARLVLPGGDNPHWT